MSPTRRRAAGGAAEEAADETRERDPHTLRLLRQRYNAALADLTKEAIDLLKAWPERKAGLRTEQYSYSVRGREISGDNFRESLSHLQIPKIGMPRDAGWGELLSFLMRENLPGAYPYTAGVFPYRRAGEDPIRMFAGEGTPERTNRRFHYLAKGQPAKRLVHRLRFGDPVRRRPAHAPGHLRQGRQLGGFDRHAGRYQEALFRF